ncbi:dTMP kinase [Patescibacteria group bacterium]
MKKGKYIVFEGISGTGKETQAKLLKTYLEKKDIHSNLVYHPSLELKNILSSWRKKRDIDSITEIYLLLADRYDHVRRIINPMLDSGKWVIALRNYISAMIYQANDAKIRIWIKEQFAKFEPVADAILYFSITPETALDRIYSRHKITGEKLGKFETLELLKEKSIAYKNVLNDIEHVEIDAVHNVEKVQDQVRISVNSLIS